MDIDRYNRFHSEIEALKNIHQYRRVFAPVGTDFSSNDYLSLSLHKKMRTTLREALKKGVAIGSGGSRLLRGHRAEHEALEEKAAHFFSQEAALFFNSGFSANYAIFSTLPSRKSAVIYDERVHASIKEGIRSSFAKKFSAKHNDLDSFENQLKKGKNLGTGELWIAIESIYSMDGDLAPLAEIQKLAKKYEAHLIVDEAHATGVFGRFGRGLVEDLENKEGIITVHPCGKALGTSGALVACPRVIKEYIINHARNFIYSTAPSPLIALSVHTALDLIDQEPWRREKLLEKVALAVQYLDQNLQNFRLLSRSTPILPVLIGDSDLTLRVSARLQENGFDVRGIRPPTVLPGKSRLRLSINVSLANDEIKRLAKTLGEIDKTYES